MALESIRRSDTSNCIGLAMEVLYLLIPLSVVLVFLIIGGIWWAIFGGQLDDLDKEGERILDD